MRFPFAGPHDASTDTKTAASSLQTGSRIRGLFRGKSKKDGSGTTDVGSAEATASGSSLAEPVAGENFGRPLGALLERDYSATDLDTGEGHLPKLLIRLVQYLTSESALGVSGLLRVAPSGKRVKELRAALDRDPQLPIVDRGEDKTHEMAAVLKQFIREIPGRLIPRANIAQVLANREDVDKLQDALDGMDDANYYTLRYLVLFLRAVAANGARNKMATPTVAMVFAPTVFSDVEASVNILDDNMQASAALMTMMEKFDEVFLSLNEATEHERMLLDANKENNKKRSCEAMEGTEEDSARPASAISPRSPVSPVNPHSAHQTLVDELQLRLSRKTHVKPSNVNNTSSGSLTNVRPFSQETQSSYASSMPASFRSATNDVALIGGTFKLTVLHGQQGQQGKEDAQAGDGANRQLLSSLTKSRAKAPKGRRAQSPTFAGSPLAVSTTSRGRPTTGDSRSDLVGGSLASLPKSILRSEGSISPSKSVRFQFPTEVTIESNTPESSQTSDEASLAVADQPTPAPIRSLSLMDASDDEESSESSVVEKGTPSNDNVSPVEHIDTAWLEPAVEMTTLTRTTEPQKARTDIVSPPAGSLTEGTSSDILPQILEYSHHLEVSLTDAAVPHPTSADKSTPLVLLGLEAFEVNKKLEVKMQKLQALGDLIRSPIVPPQHYLQSAGCDSAPAAAILTSSAASIVTHPVAPVVMSSIEPSKISSSAGIETALALPIAMPLSNAHDAQCVSAETQLFEKSKPKSRNQSAPGSARQIRLQRKQSKALSLKQNIAANDCVVGNVSIEDKKPHVDIVEKNPDEGTSMALHIETGISSNVIEPRYEPTIVFTVGTTNSDPSDDIGLPQLAHIIVPTVPLADLTVASKKQLLLSFKQLNASLKEFQAFLRSIKPFVVQEDPEYELKLSFYQNLLGQYKAAAENYATAKVYIQGKVVSAPAIRTRLMSPATNYSPLDDDTSERDRPSSPDDPHEAKHMIKKEIHRLKSLLGRLAELPRTNDVERQMQELRGTLDMYHARYKELKNVIEKYPRAGRQWTVASEASEVSPTNVRSTSHEEPQTRTPEILNSSATPTAVDMTAIKAEKKLVQRQLLTFQEEFRSKYGRQPTRANDYAPILETYHRYKALKSQLPQ